MDMVAIGTVVFDEPPQLTTAGMPRKTVRR
jgi:hypothetical protein